MSGSHLVEPEDRAFEANEFDRSSEAESPFLLGESPGQEFSQAAEAMEHSETFPAAGSAGAVTNEYAPAQEYGETQAAAAEFDPYLAIRPALSPEHAHLGSDEIAMIFGRKPAIVALHSLLGSRALRDATLVALLGRGGGRTVRVNAVDVPLATYLRGLSRLAWEAAEHSLAETGETSAEVAAEFETPRTGEGAPMPDEQLQALIDEVLADGAAQADVEALLAEVPQGDATEGLENYSPDARRRGDSSHPPAGGGVTANKLVVTARNWAAKGVACRFTATADGKALAAADATNPVYEIPPGTAEVQVTATPKASVYWPTTITLSVSNTGVISPKANSSAFVNVTAAAGASKGLTQASIKVSRFKEVTTRVFDLLKKIPLPRVGKAPDGPELTATYGAWPPKNWNINPAPDAHYLDVKAPVKPGALNFAKDTSLKVEVESVVLELAGGSPPRLYGVTWPKAIAPKDGADPTRFLLFLRQTGGQDAEHGVFTGGGVKGQPYPYNFDYAERCLFESLHYGKTPLFKAIGWTLRPKGVPYQVAKSGAKVVTVFPVAAIPGEYGVLADMAQTGQILEELQAFMFWRAGIHTPPASLGNTAIAAYSSTTSYVLAKWLVDPKNRASSFFKNTVRAIYFLDPPEVDVCVTAALAWARWAGSDKRIRLYSRKLEKDAFRALLGLKPHDPALPAPPFVQNSPDNKRTVASLSVDSWVKTFKDTLGVDVALAWWDVHHFIPATVLTHALAQGDI
jgi:hypothetical protein